MNCKEIQDVIITDYVDNELDEKKRNEIEHHLSYCSNCRAFKEVLITKVIQPLRDAYTAKLPDNFYNRIKNYIEQERAKDDVFGIGEIISFFKPRWANIATLVSMLLFTLFAGSFLAQNILKLASNQETVAEAANGLGVTAFNDIASEQVETVYNQIITI